LGGLLEVALTVTLVRQSGSTPLYVASRMGHVEVVGALLAKGADVEAKTNVRDS
jgi:ankyrin repeat protein